MILKSQHKVGFTLIEILLTVTLVSIFLGIGVTAARAGQERARDNERKVTLERLRVALELYRDKNNTYPSTNGAWYSSESGDRISNNNGNWIPGLAPAYIAELPRDPRGGASTLSACVAGWRSAYVYRSDGTEYSLLAHCSPERPISVSDPYYDSVRPTYAFKVCSSGGCSYLLDLN